jgi:hypothetical protein
MSDTHNVITPETGVPIHAWTRGVAIEAEAEKQLRNVAQMLFVSHRAMPTCTGELSHRRQRHPTKGDFLPLSR